MAKEGIRRTPRRRSLWRYLKKFIRSPTHRTRRRNDRNHYSLSLSIYLLNLLDVTLSFDLKLLETAKNGGVEFTQHTTLLNGRGTFSNPNLSLQTTET